MKRVDPHGALFSEPSGRQISEKYLRPHHWIRNCVNGSLIHYFGVYHRPNGKHSDKVTADRCFLTHYMPKKKGGPSVILSNVTDGKFAGLSFFKPVIFHTDICRTFYSDTKLPRF